MTCARRSGREQYASSTKQSVDRDEWFASRVETFRGLNDREPAQVAVSNPSRAENRTAPPGKPPPLFPLDQFAVDLRDHADELFQSRRRIRVAKKNVKAAKEAGSGTNTPAMSPWKLPMISSIVGLASG